MGTHTRETHFSLGNLTADLTTAALEDGTDSIHTGILKTLNQQSAGSFVASGLNVTQSTAGSKPISVSTGVWFDRGEYKSGQPADVNDTLSSGTYDHYAFLVIPKDWSSGTALVLRVHATAGDDKVKVASLQEGDIPVCLMQVLASGAIVGNRKIQYYGIKKLDSKFSAVDDGAVTLTINKDGTITKGGGTLTFPSSTGTIARTADVAYASAISPGNDGLVPSAGTSGHFLAPVSYTHLTLPTKA